MTTKKHGSAKATARPRLTRERVVAAALAIVDRDGLDALTMRALGQELCCDPMSAYRHVRDKEALLDAIVEAVWQEIEIPEDGLPGTWQEQFKEAFRIVRATFKRHPNALPVVATRPSVSPTSLRRMEFALAILDGAGFDLLDAAYALNLMFGFVVGSALSDIAFTPDVGGEGHLEAVRSVYRRTSPAEFPVLARLWSGSVMPDFEGQFEAGVDAIVRGLEPLAGKASPES